MSASSEPTLSLDVPLLPGAVLEQADMAVIVTDRYSNVRYWNKFAERLFGFTAGQVVGRSVMEFGIAAEDRYQAMQLARQVLKGRSWEGTFCGVRSDGSRIFSRVHAVPCREADEITGVVLFAREALRDGERRREDRLALLSKLGNELSRALLFNVTLRRVAEILVPQFADHIFIDLFDDDGRLRRHVSHHTGGWRPPKGWWGDVGDEIKYPRNHFCWRALDAEQTIRVSDPERAAHFAPTADGVRLYKHLRVHSAIAAPLVARGVIHGVLSLATSGLTEDRADPSYDVDDQALVSAVASRIALAIDNARLFEEERRTALAFQRGLLPEELPDVDGLDHWHVYEPAEPLVDNGVQTQVGGDWYDVIPLSSGRVGIVIGDVEGRGPRAAAIMSQLRAAVRAFAVYDIAPAELLGKLEEWVRSFGRDPAEWTPGDDRPLVPFVTCLYMVYDAWARQLWFANAGHAPPLVIDDGDVRELEVNPGVPLGASSRWVHVPPPEEQSCELSPGTTLLLYTDGLIERRPRDFDGDPMEVLVERISRVARGSPRLVASAAVEAVPGEIDDDVAVLVLRTSDRDLQVVEQRFPADPIMVSESRRMAAETFVEWEIPPEQTEVACLLVSEVVTNAVRHAMVTPSPRSGEDSFLEFAEMMLDDDADPWEPSALTSRASPPKEFRLRLRRGAHALWVEVYDQDLRLPRIRMAEPHDEGGRGLYLVDNLASRWGSRATPDGKWVWFELGL